MVVTILLRAGALWLGRLLTLKTGKFLTQLNLRITVKATWVVTAAVINLPLATLRAIVLKMRLILKLGQIRRIK